MSTQSENVVAELLAHPYYQSRSAVYREGVRDGLMRLAARVVKGAPYADGTIERDAYDAGRRMSHSTWQTYQDQVRRKLVEPMSAVTSTENPT